MHDDFNVIYPPIVEQAFEFMRHVDGLEDVTKAEVYRALVSKRLIDDKGNPTEKAISSGFVSKGFALPTQELANIANKVLPPEYRGNYLEGTTFINPDAIDYLEKLVKSNSPNADDAVLLLKFLVCNTEIDTQDIDYLKGIASGDLKVIKNKEKLNELLPILDYFFIEGHTPNDQGGNIVIQYKEALKAYEVAYKTAPNEVFKGIAKKILDTLKSL